MLRAFYKKHRALILYGLVGAVTIPLNWAVYSLGVELGWRVWLANAAAWLISSLWAYAANKLWVFEERSWEPRVVAREAGTFFGVRAVSAVFELFVQPLLAGTGLLGQPLFGVDGLPAKIAVTAVCVGINYVMSKKLIFGKK